MNLMFWKDREREQEKPEPPPQDLVFGRYFFAEEKQDENTNCPCVYFQVFRSERVANVSQRTGEVFTAWNREQARQIIEHLDEVLDMERAAQEKPIARKKAK